MKRTRQCPRCQSTRLWHVAQMIDHARDGQELPLRVYLEMDAFGINVVREHGSFELYVCQRCGAVEWYALGTQSILADAREVDLLIAQPDKKGKERAMRESRTCPKCMGGSVLLVREVRERSDSAAQALSVFRTPNRWMWTVDAGTFELSVCAGCGFVEWCAFKRHLLIESPKDGLVLWQGTLVCASCAMKKMWRVSTVRELPGGRALTLPGGQGAFSIDVCDGCGFTSWTLHAPEKIFDDPARGITGSERAVKADEGPYR